MKFFLLATLVIAAVVAEPEAEAESKPQYFGSYGYNAYSPYTAGYASYSPYTAGYASTYSSPYYGAYGSHYLGKREAEAEPQYYGAYGYNAYSPYTAYSSYSPYTSYASTYSTPYASYGSHFVGKREAESKPELVYTDGTFHTNVANLQKGVNNQYVKPYGAVYNSVPATVAYQQPALAYAAAPVAVQQPYFATGYNRLYKREAEAEPQYYYGGAYSPYSYSNGYSSYGGYPYAYGSSYGGLYGGYRSPYFG